MTKTAIRKEMDAEIKTRREAANPGRRARIVSILEGVVIGTAIVLAIGFYLGDHYANNKNAQTNAAVTHAVSQLKVKQ